MSNLSRRELLFGARNLGLAALTGGLGAGLLALSGCKLRVVNPMITLDEFAEIADNRPFVWDKISVTNGQGRVWE